MLKHQAKLTGTTQRTQTTELRFAVQNDEIDQIDLAEMTKKKGWIYFSHDEQNAKIERIMGERRIVETRNGRTPSQRLRGILFELWDGGTQTHELQTEDFPAFYLRKMEQLIEHFNKKI